jgi:FkbM family methyltransferase
MINQSPQQSIYKLLQGSTVTTIIDVGANVGIYSVLFGKKFPAGKVIAFEPNVSLHVLLSQNLDLNNVNNVRIENLALSNTEVVGQIEISKGRAGAGKIKSTLAEDYGDESFPIITGDMYVQDFPEAMPSLIKIDVEGFEVQVLGGSSKFILKHKPYFSIDIHQSVDGSKETTETACRQILEKYGYSFQMMGHVLLASPESNNSLL